MARLKFLLFALLVLSLWVAHLMVLSPALTARAVELAAAQAQSAPSAVSARMMELRLEAQRVALRAAASPRVTTALAALMPGVPDALRTNFLIGVVNEGSSLFSKGEEEPKAEFTGIDVAAAAQAGSDGLLQQLGEKPYVLYSFPAKPNGAGQPAAEPKSLATLVVGAPLLPDSAIADAVKATGLAGILLLQSGKVVADAGLDKPSIDAAFKSLHTGRTAVVSRGPVMALGPLDLPAFTQPGRWAASQSPLRVGFRQAVEGTPFEVVTVASVRSFTTALASYQKLAVFGFLALLALTVLWTLLMDGGSRRSRATAEVREERPAPARAPEAPPPPAAVTPSLTEEPAFEPPPVSTAHYAEEFPPAPPPSEYASPPMEPQPTFDGAQAENAAGSEAAHFDAEATRAYPIQPGDPLLMPPEESSGYGFEESNEDATRVAMIPDELLRASARPASEMSYESTGQGSRDASGDVVSQAQEEQYFQDLYREFVATRERCREAGPGMSYDKFALKLRRSKEQLTQKYNCRFVRFHVYVKEGKAALKATPVKD